MGASERYFIDRFNSYFKTFRESFTPIAFYGIGEKTQLLLEHIQGYNIVGLMDKDSSGMTIYDLPVLSEADVAEKAKCIIIVANMSIAPLVYQRIADLKKNKGLDIFYINGTIPQEIQSPAINDLSPELNAHHLVQAIDHNEIISFDLFDTLIMRKVFLPTDLFHLVERTLLEKYSLNIDFKRQRIEAEKMCYRNKDKYCTIHDIYHTLQTLLNCNDELIQIVKQIELDVEYKYCAPRKVLVDLCGYARRIGKTVLITTDTFLTKDIVVPLLIKCGIIHYDLLLISCEERKLKHLGDMWEHVAALFKGRRILHIGDNPFTDMEMPRKHNVNTFKIERAYDALHDSALNELMQPKRMIDDSLLLGQLNARFLNDPFVLRSNNGRLPIQSMFDLGYLSFGPLVLNYLRWLIKKSSEDGIEKMLFFARDGYILDKIYRRFCVFYDIQPAKAIYFLTSRRAASVAAIKTRGDIAFIVNHMCKTRKITFDRLLITAFGVPSGRNDPLHSIPCYELTTQDIIEHIIGWYQEAILDNAASERLNYLRYMSLLGIKGTDNIGCVNFVGRGITQRFISGLLEKELAGYYFAKEIDLLDIHGESNRCYALYDEPISPHLSRNHLATKYIYGEVVLSSPDEQLVRFNHHGQPIFEQKGVDRNFEPIRQCQAGMERFIEDMAACDDRLFSRNFSHEIIDNLYGLFASPACICSEEIKKNFQFSDYYNQEFPETILGLY